MKQYTEKSSVRKNYMFQLGIDILANCTRIHGIFLKKTILIMIKSNRGKRQLTRTMSTSSEHVKLRDRIFFNVEK